MKLCAPLAVLCLGALLGRSGAPATARPHPVAIAQLTLPANAPAPTISGLVVNGIYVTAPIVLDGVTLFRIGAPVNAPLTELPLATRVADIGTALAQVLAETGSGRNAKPVFDPASLRVHLAREGDVAVLAATDRNHPDPLPLVTVTTNDVRANSASNVDALGAQWQSTLQGALVRALELRQPAAEKRSLRQIVQVAGALLIVTIAVFLLLRFLWRRMQQLESEVQERALAAQAALPQASEEPGTSDQRRGFFMLSLHNLEPQRKLSVYGALAETLAWALTLSWFVAVTWGLSLFAQTTPLAQSIAHSTVAVVSTIVITGLLNRLLDLVIARVATAWRLRRLGTSEDRARLLLRIPTITRAISGAKTFLLVFLAALSICGQVGVPIGSVITIGGLAAIALSLAAQNFVRDFLNGFLVLLEDQYVVGDYVTINAFSGSVERLTLRMVQIRDAGGDLITIPHSSVVSVLNQSRNWSRIDYRVPIDPAADVAQAIEIVQVQIEALISAGEWTSGITEPLEWIGVDALSRDAVVVRASVRTAPLRQFELRRRINADVRRALTQAGIALGAPPAA